MCMFLLTGLIYFLYKVYHMIHKTHPRFETLQTDISVLEPLVDKLCNELGECQTNVRRSCCLRGAQWPARNAM